MYQNKKKINIGFNIFTNEKSPNVDYKYGVYNSAQEAFDYLGEDGLDVLAVGLTVGIKTENGIVEYWFKKKCDSVEDLVPKQRDLYQVWLDSGHEGTEEDFLLWLRGDAEDLSDLKARLEAQETINIEQQAQIDKNLQVNNAQQETIEDIIEEEATEEDIEAMFQ